MIINYLPYVFGSVFLFGGLYSFVISFGIYKPKFKTDEQKLRFDDSLKKFGKLLKICSIGMILYGAYNLIWHNTDMYRLNNTVENSKWTDKDRAKLLKIYINSVSPKNKEHPQLVADYCACSVNMIMKNLTRQQYIDDLALPKNEQDNIFGPILKDCVTTYQRRLDSVKNRGNNI